MCTTTIVLDSPPDQAFAPGDTVSGKVFCKINKQTKIKTADIQLTGKVYARHVSSNGQVASMTEERTLLFRKTTTLFQGPFTLQPQTVEWPFEFVIPLSGTYDRGPRDDDDQFLSPGDSSLPPSLSCNTSDFGANRGSAIVYSLKASIAKGGVLPDRATRLELLLLPTMPVPANEPLLTAISLPATPWSDKVVQHRSLKARVKHMFAPDPAPATPGPSFTPTLHMPTAISPSDTAPLGISIAWTPPSHSPPTLLLRSLRVSLTAHYRFRTASPIRDHTATHSRTEGILDLPDLSLPLPPSTSTVHPIHSLSLPDISPRPSPDFSSWTVARAHTASIAVRLVDQTTGREFRVRSDGVPFVCRPRHESMVAPPGYVGRAAACEVVAKPPAYRGGGRGGELALEGSMQVAV